LHGIGMHPWSLGRIGRALRADGYTVLNLSYPSRRLPLEVLAGEYVPAQLRRHGTADAPRLHFVAHSMGGLVARRLIQEARPANLGRVVMLGTPNRGSAAADVAARNPLLRRFFGGNLILLGVGDQGIVRSLGPADFEVGIIAGSFAFNRLFSPVLAGPHDGVVTVESARLEGMRDFIVLPFSHTFMLWRAEVVRQVRAFLSGGQFARKAPHAPGAVR
jgi:pimeloyl-ACP methyl ester carboxylesterase